MNQEVQDFIEKSKQLIEEYNLEEKAKVLLSAGICKKMVTFSDRWTVDCQKWDVEKQKYYGLKQVPIEVSDEEYAEVLKYSKLIKDIGEQTTSDSSIENIRAENALNNTAMVELVCGIIISFILFCAGFAIDGFLVYGLCLGVVILIMSIVNWSIMKVLANISISLKEINRKVK